MSSYRNDPTLLGACADRTNEKRNPLQLCGLRETHPQISYPDQDDLVSASRLAKAASGRYQIGPGIVKGGSRQSATIPQRIVALVAGSLGIELADLWGEWSRWDGMEVRRTILIGVIRDSLSPTPSFPKLAEAIRRPDHSAISRAYGRWRSYSPPVRTAILDSYQASDTATFNELVRAVEAM